MEVSRRNEFLQLMMDIYGFYGRQISPFAFSVWWEAMLPYSFEAIRQALNRHCVNPDVGQFLPKPADVVRMLAGRSEDRAFMAWSNLDKAVRLIGPYKSVSFIDDPLINQVVSEMGGWISLCNKTDEAWPFVAREFMNRYRGYAMRNIQPECPPVLIGIAEANNVIEGQPIEPTVLIGNAVKSCEPKKLH